MTVSIVLDSTLPLCFNFIFNSLFALCMLQKSRNGWAAFICFNIASALVVMVVCNFMIRQPEITNVPLQWLLL